MDDPTIPGLTGALDYQPERREEGIAFTLYPADTSEPLAYILRGPGAEEIAKRLVQRWNSHDGILAALKEARRAIGDHHAPDHCYATGPMTGDAIRDLVQCPACSAIEMYDAAIAKESAS